MLLQKEKASVVIFNMQLDLIPLLQNGTQLLNDCCWLADMCCDLQVPTRIIEHKKLGKLSRSLTEVAGKADYLEKTHFDFMEEPVAATAVEAAGQDHYVLAGAETHVCILQSAFRLQAQGKKVFLLADTCSARSRTDHEAALQRLGRSGIELITREMFFFELIRHSEYPNYLNLAMKYLDGRYIR
ncbi:MULTISPECIES: isochorismatase family protein [unclassified Haematospirillum]|uniref:isochorismatase family protein n=1 Tax=unclassified Haematospirillum TaxID=2622088 RepID=UPI00143BE2BD|nr:MULTISPECIES: isochorismatase family protein [unclassified Haematospirillum]NKD55168.1 isochorismatase family protein [Haematospirillum sp. H4890]NKD75053.1 isochorismatase family protein [Haematospirillum sp. H4485]